MDDEIEDEEEPAEGEEVPAAAVVVEDKKGSEEVPVMDEGDTQAQQQ